MVFDFVFYDHSVAYDHYCWMVLLLEQQGELVQPVMAG
jgi:hypothetical protein